MEITNKKVNFFLAAYWIGIVLWIAINLIFKRYPNHLANFFFIGYTPKSDIFMDFFNTNHDAANRNPYQIYIPASHPPLAQVVPILSRLIYNTRIDTYLARTNQLATMLLFVYEMVMYASLGVLCFTKLKIGSSLKGAVFTACLLFSMPSLWLLERGNDLIIAIVALMFFALYYFSERKIMKEFSLLALAIAIALKPNLLLILFLLILDKQWKSTIKVMIYGGALTLVGLLMLKGNPFQNMLLFVQSLFSWISKIEANDRVVAYQVGIGPLIRTLTMFINHGISLAWQANVKTYVSILLVLVSIFALLRQKVFWKRFAILISLAVLLPGGSVLYNLDYYLIVAVLMIISAEDLKTVIPSLIMMVLILIPKQFLIIYRFDYYVLDTNTFLSNIFAIIFWAFLLFDSLKGFDFLHPSRWPKIQFNLSSLRLSQTKR